MPVCAVSWAAGKDGQSQTYNFSGHSPDYPGCDVLAVIILTHYAEIGKCKLYGFCSRRLWHITVQEGPELLLWPGCTTERKIPPGQQISLGIGNIRLGKADPASIFHDPAFTDDPPYIFSDASDKLHITRHRRAIASHGEICHSTDQIRQIIQKAAVDKSQRVLVLRPDSQFCPDASFLQPDTTDPAVCPDIFRCFCDNTAYLSVCPLPV